MVASEPSIYVWVFNGNSSKFPSAVFATRERAEAWISQGKLAGTLTRYPVDLPVYDWAIESNFFLPKSEKHKSAEFIANFTTAGQEHYHFGE